jgi:hypothetical protein
VKPFDVIDVLFSATQWHTAVVQRVDQDDLCEAEYNKLSAAEKDEYEAIPPSGGALWRPSTQSDNPLLLRILAQKLSAITLFSGPSSVHVQAPACTDVPRGVFNVLLSTKGLLNKQLAKGLTGSQTLSFSTQVCATLGNGCESSPH